MRRSLVGLVAVALVLVPAASASAANRWIQKRAPLNIAHQGGEDEFPSNTMYAFRKALRAGADMLELDIGVTRDNKVIVIRFDDMDPGVNFTAVSWDRALLQEQLDADELIAFAEQWQDGAATPERICG